MTNHPHAPFLQPPTQIHLSFGAIVRHAEWIGVVIAADAQTAQEVVIRSCPVEAGRPPVPTTLPLAVTSPPYEIVGHWGGARHGRESTKPGSQKTFSGDAEGAANLAALDAYLTRYAEEIRKGGR